MRPLQKLVRKLLLKLRRGFNQPAPMERGWRDVEHALLRSEEAWESSEVSFFGVREVVRVRFFFFFNFMYNLFFFGLASFV